MNVQLDQRPIAPAIWIVVVEEDWSGVNDCGAIYIPDRNLAKVSGAIEQIHLQPSQGLNDDWSIEQCS